MKKLLLSVIAMITALAAHCADFSVDMLGYTILDTEAHTVQLSSVELTYPNEQINIPGTVVYDGVTYTVTSVNIRLSSISHKNISTITVPKTVTDIECLSGNDITQILLDEGSQLKSIGKEAFRSCKFSEFKLPESIESIGEGAFRYCTKLKSIDIPESIDTIKATTFSNCDGLTNVKLPSGLKVIEYRAFYKFGNDVEKTIVTLPEHLDSIGSSAFCHADISPTGAVPPALASDAFGYNVTAFITDFSLLDAYSDAEIWEAYIKGPVINVGDFTYQVITSYKAELIGITPQSSITVPETISYDKFKFAITAIKNNVFKSSTPDETNAEQIKEIRIKAHVTTIGKQSFPSGLTYIELPQELQRIEYNTFKGCRLLRNVNIPDSVEYIGEYAFADCGIETFTAPKKLTRIENGTFCGCNSLRAVTLNDEITSIGIEAFRGCIFENIKLPAELQILKTHSFAECKNLNTLSLPDKIVSTYLDVIAGSGVTELRIPHTIKSIGICDYFYIKEYPYMPIIDSLKNIFITGGSNERYYDVDGVLFRKNGDNEHSELICYPCNRDAAEYTVPDGTMYIEQHAFARPKHQSPVKTPLKKVNLPESIIKIQTAAFANNYSLESINLPNSLTTIYNKAFYGDRLLTVRIPKSVTFVSDEAFTVNTVYIDAVTPPSCSSNPISGGKTICVKPEAVEAYRNDDTWSKYRIISDVHEADGLIYVPDGDNKAELAGYIKTPENTFDIPQTVNIGSKTRTVTTIGPNALALGAFTSVNVPKTVESIGQRCFDYCDNLTSVHISEAKVQQPNLNLCGNLQNISADGSNAWHTVINGVLYNKAADTLQAYPVASTCEAFVLPESVKAIENTVCNYDLSETGFKSFYSTGQTPPACGSSSFSGVQYNQGMTLYVPQNSVQEYSEADGWRYFNNIVGLTDDEIRDVLLTSVSDIKADDNATHPSADVFYTISGQRVTKPGKGIYIRNGKKVVVR